MALNGVIALSVFFTEFDCFARQLRHIYRRETALQGGLVMANSGRLELGDNILLTL